MERVILESKFPTNAYTELALEALRTGKYFEIALFDVAPHLKLRLVYKPGWGRFQVQNLTDLESGLIKIVATVRPVFTVDQESGEKILEEESTRWKLHHTLNWVQGDFMLAYEEYKKRLTQES